MSKELAVIDIKAEGEMKKTKQKKDQKNKVCHVKPAV